MKKITFLIFSIILFSCSEKPVPEPDTLLDEKVMVDILFDTAILQASESYLPDKLTENNVRIKNYIYTKYSIDSITYYQNQRYYASDSRKYRDMHKEVLERIDQLKAETDTLIKHEGVKGGLLKEKNLTKTLETKE